MVCWHYTHLIHFLINLFILSFMHLLGRKQKPKKTPYHWEIKMVPHKTPRWQWGFCEGGWTKTHLYHPNHRMSQMLEVTCFSLSVLGFLGNKWHFTIVQWIMSESAYWINLFIQNISFFINDSIQVGNTKTDANI